MILFQKKKVAKNNKLLVLAQLPRSFVHRIYSDEKERKVRET